MAYSLELRAVNKRYAGVAANDAVSLGVEPGEIHAAAEPVEAAPEEDETVDLAAVLGGNIRKAPSAASEPEAENEPISAQAAV